MKRKHFLRSSCKVCGKVCEKENAHVNKFFSLYLENNKEGCLAGQSVEHVTLDLGVMSLSPTSGAGITLKKSLKK